MTEASADTDGTATAVARAGPTGWRSIVRFPLVAMILALTGFALLIAAASFVITAALPPALPEAASLAIDGIVTPLAAILAYKLVIPRLGESPRDDLPLDRRLVDLGRGTLLALLLMSLIVGVTMLLGGYRIAGWGGSTSWAVILFLAGTQAAVVEEILFRGILFRFLEEFGGSWFALALSAAVFGALHAFNDNATVLSSVAIAVEAGVLLGGAYMLTRDLWLAIGIHFGWNVTQGYLWDVSVSGFAVDGLVEAYPQGAELISGGAFGLEASLAAMVLATSCGIWLVARAVRRGLVVRPWWVRRRLGLALPA